MACKMKWYLALSLCLLFTGCKVGPNYTPPVVEMPITFREDQPEQTFLIEDEDLVEWWTIFEDPFLDELLEETIDDNFDYQIALSQVIQARAQYWTQFTQILPEFDADAEATRFRTSESFAAIKSSPVPVPPVQSFFQIGIDAIWEIDFFGKLRRNAESAYDLWEASTDLARGVKITVISEVANTYAIICALQKKFEIAIQIINLEEDILSLSRTLFEAGLADEQEVAAAIATLESDKAQLVTVETSLKQAIYSLATLLGRLPESVMDDFAIIRPIPHSEGKIPTSIPGELLRRRPDIRAAERQLASATEQIGVAVAALFPDVSLTGSSSSYASNPLQGANTGFSSDHFNALFTAPSWIWGVGAFVTQPVLDFGKRQAAIDVQVELRNQAYLNYKKTVIAALQETEQALLTYFNDEEKNHYLYQEVKANQRSLNLIVDLFEAGLANYTQVLQARDVWLTSENAFVDSQQALTSDLIAVYKALGGDW